jgi:excisionase family DNA binding protein
VTLQKAAERLGVSLRSVRRILEKGALQGYRYMGNRVGVSRAELEVFAAEFLTPRPIGPAAPDRKQPRRKR